MAKLSYYNTVTVPGNSDYIPMFNSGVSNSRILPSSLISGAFGFSGNSGKIISTDGGTLVWVNSGGGAGGTPAGVNSYIQYNNSGSFGGSSGLVWSASGNRLGINTASPQETVDVRGRVYIDRSGMEDFTNTNNAFLSIGSYQSNGGANWGELAIGIDTSGNSHLQTYNGKDLVINQYGNKIGFFCHPNPNFYATFNQNVGPSSTNTTDFGSSSYAWKSGYFNYVEATNLNVNNTITGSGLSISGSGSFNYVRTHSGIYTPSSGTADIGSSANPFGSGYINYLQAAILNVSGNCNSFASGPIFARAINSGAAIYGTALTLDSSNLAGGKKLSFISTGPNAGVGAGYFAIYNATDAYYPFSMKYDGKFFFAKNFGTDIGARVVIRSELGEVGLSIYTLAGQSADCININNEGVICLKITNSGDIIPGTNNSRVIGTSTIAMASGYFSRLIVNSGISGAAYTWPQPFGWAFPSGTVSGTGVNVSYEIPIPINCILQSGGYACIRSKTAASGNASGFVVDINYNGTSIWSGASGLRLTMANNTRSGEQGNFAYSGIMMRQGGYLSLDFVSVPTGTYANDIVVELLTMAQK